MILFINASSLTTLLAAIEAGTIESTCIAFIPSENLIYANGTTYECNFDSSDLEEAIATINEYTINGYVISSNPVLNNEDIGLGEVTNDAQVKRSEMGVANGVATLDEDGLVPESLLPSYVDDVVDVYAVYSMTATGLLTDIELYTDEEHTTLVEGETDKIYVDVTDGNPSYQFRYSGTTFVLVASGGLIIGTVEGTAYDGASGQSHQDALESYPDTVISTIESPTAGESNVTINYTYVTKNTDNISVGDIVEETLTIDAATTSQAGVMTAEDKSNLDTTVSGLAAEIAAREEADTTLLTNIDNEAATREATDTDLQTLITSNDEDIATLKAYTSNLLEQITYNDEDIAELQIADQTLQSNIDTLETSLTNSLTELETSVNNSLEELETSLNTSVVAKAEYNSSTKEIILYSSDDTVLSTIDATDFIKDGMLDSVDLVSEDADGNEGTYLKLVFNTDAEKDPIYLDTSSLVDIYTGSNGVTVDDYIISAVKSINSEKYLYIDDTGIGVSGIDEPLQSLQLLITYNDRDIEDLQAVDETLQSNIDEVTTWIDSNVVTGDDVDTYILEVEDETNYGMAKAMGVE